MSVRLIGTADLIVVVEVSVSVSVDVVVANAVTVARLVLVTKLVVKAVTVDDTPVTLIHVLENTLTKSRCYSRYGVSALSNRQSLNRNSTRGILRRGC